MRRLKKSKYKSVVIKKKRYYFYKITWADITGDSGHATEHDFMGFLPSIMVTHAYMFSKDKKYVRTFASYEEGDELFSDRNVFPIGCIVKMEKGYSLISFVSVILFSFSSLSRFISASRSLISVALIFTL